MGKGIQETSEDHKADQRPCGAGDTPACARRAGRKAAETEPGINDGDLLQGIAQVWPRLWECFDTSFDTRAKGRIRFPLFFEIMLAVIERLMGMMSGRQHDRFKMSPEFRENIHALLGDGDESAPLPHSSSIEYTFRSLSVDCIRTGIEKMARRLLRGKRLECMRTAIPQHGKQYYRVAIDAVHFNTSTRPIGHAVHKKRADGTVGLIREKIYGHYPSICRFNAKLVDRSGRIMATI